jgi:hypothetical protein
VEKIMNLLGIAGVVGGFCLIAVQGITYLMKGTWISYSVYGIAEKYGLGDMLASHPGLMDIMEKCPLSFAIIVMGVIFLWITSRLKSV